MWFKPELLFSFILLFLNLPLLGSADEYEPQALEACALKTDAEEIFSNQSISCMPGNAVTIAPEYYYLKRKRSGGTSQSGNLGGIRLSYDHIKRYHIYWGLQGFYGGGILNGHSGNGSKIRSRWSDTQIEGYLGYTFQMKEFPFAGITPYVGYGYFEERNKFISPSPLHVKFLTKFGYLSYGFLLQVYVNECLSIGLNTRFRNPWEPKNKVTNDPDPEVNNSEILIGSRLQYRIELPVIYQKSLFCNHFHFGLVPFFEWREFGGRESYPFDFLKTKIKIFGINLSLLYQF